MSSLLPPKILAARLSPLLGIKPFGRPGKGNSIRQHAGLNSRRHYQHVTLAGGPDDTSTSQPKAGASKLLLGGTVTAGALIVGVAASKGYDIPLAVADLERAITNAGPLGPIYFAAAYSLACVLLIPASVLTLAAGYLFGPVAGTAIVSLSSTLGASLAFLIARFGARPLLEPRLQGNPRFASIDRGIAEQGGRFVLLLRLSPLLPFGLLNYSLGLTSVGFWPYVGASWLGMLPGTFAYVYLGGAGRATLAGGGDFDAVKIGLYALGAGATLYATKIISGIAGQALKESEG